MRLDRSWFLCSSLHLLFSLVIFCCSDSVLNTQYQRYSEGTQGSHSIAATLPFSPLQQSMVPADHIYLGGTGVQRQLSNWVFMPVLRQVLHTVLSSSSLHGLCYLGCLVSGLHVENGVSTVAAGCLGLSLHLLRNMEKYLSLIYLSICLGYIMLL